MIRLTLLRGIGLFDETGTSIDRVVQQPKRLAVLAYLALVGRGVGCQRDALFGLFWPELTARRARQALNSTTHFLRQQLGQEIIERRGPDTIGLASGALWCDAAAFLDAVDLDPEGALGLYAGDLLPAFFIGAGYEFDRWLDGERRRLRGLAADAAWRLARKAADAGDAHDVIRWARRLLELADNDEVMVEQVVALMARAGDRSGALEVYGRFASRLAEECPGAHPSTETLAIVERIRSGEPLPGVLPEPLTASVAHASSHTGFDRTADPARAHTQQGVIPPNGTATARRRGFVQARLALAGADRWAVGLVSGATLAAALLLTAAAHSSRVASRSAAVLPRIEIVRFAALDGSPATAQAAAVLTEAVVDRLARPRVLDVVEPLGDGRSAPGADLVARGSVTQSGSHLLVGVELIDGRAGTTVRTARFETVGDAVTSADSLAGRISELVQQTLRRQLRLRRIRESLHDARLYRLVQDVDEDRERADELRQQGHPDAAMRALANADTTLTVVERAVPTNADVRTLRANVLGSLAIAYLLPPTADRPRLRATLVQAVAEADSAMTLDSGSADAAEAFALTGKVYQLLMAVPADSSARMSARIERALHRAIAIDPLRPGAWTQLSLLLYLRGDYSGAYDAARHAYDTDAFGEHTQELLMRLSISAYEIGDDSASAQWCNEMARKLPRSSASAYCSLTVAARTGRPDASSLRRVWQLVDQGSRAPDADPLMPARLQMLAATALARAGASDSAEHVIARARAGAASDPELWLYEAEARLQLGERAIADSLVRQYVAIAPTERAGVLRSRRFRALGAG